MFQSQLYAGETVIDQDGHPACSAPPEPDGTPRAFGRVPRDWAAQPYGSLASASPFPRGIIIPRDKWTGIIQAAEADQSNISSMLLNSNPYISSLDQDSTNFCWCNAVVGAVQFTRLRMGQPYVPLSACSVAAPVKGYRNQGGSGYEALEKIVSDGIAPLELWPNSTKGIRSSYDNDDTRKARENYKVTEFWELQSGDFDAVMTCCLLRIPVAIGLDWWSHEVMACDGVVLSPNRFGIRFRNSWSDTYGSKGFNVLTEAKATPDDACCPRVALAA